MSDKDFPTISTGNGFQNDLIATTNDRIKRQVLATNELHKTITDLNKSIKVFNKKSSDQTDQVIKLTRRIVYLTIALVIGLVIQIILSL